ncbi:aspartate-semialdehyde dehydrogenase [bacterium]|nr:aspartate-semialdehyde dehydrogenase [bacterium]
MNGYSVAILGATGMVGQEMLRTLLDRGFPARSIKLLASSRTAGSTVTCRGRDFVVELATPEAFEGVELVLASAGGSVSRVLAPEAVKRGAVVVDNTSEFRLHDDVPLVIPEINGHALKNHHGIIANPNCSTAILLMALAPLRALAKIERVVVTTFQSVSGAGKEAVDELYAQSEAHLEGVALAPQALNKPIAFNLIPHIDVFQDNGYTKEEMKFTHETRKIFEAPDFRISGTCVRVPVAVSHSESVNVEFDRPVSPDEVRAALAGAAGVRVSDEPATSTYPQPTDAAGIDEVLVGRIRGDVSHPNAVNLWVVGDNLRRGAALNAVLIAESLHTQGLLGNKVSC